MALVVGCGARTLPSVDPDLGDAGQPTLDAGRDAGRDAGPRDAGHDAGTFTPCSSDRDCAADVCRARPGFAPSDERPLPLACAPAEVDRAPVTAPCASRSDCDRGLCALPGACLMPCANDADCAAGERCREAWVRTAPVAMQPVRACVALVAAPDSVRVAGPEPGPVLPRFFGETADDLLPDLPPSSLVVWTAGAGTQPFIQEIRARPAGEVVFDAFTGGPGAPAPAWGVSPTTVTDMATLLSPNGPGTPRSPAGFTVHLASEGPGPSERFVLSRDGEGRVLDLDVYLVGGGDWRSDDGRVPRELARALDDARAILAPTGVEIGVVRVHEVVGALRRRYEVLEGATGPLGVPTDLAALYQLSAGAREPSVHVFFVRMIDGALGIASGIPGPHAMPGNGASGVAIATDLIPSARLGGVIVHEIGHFVGLFHTSELDGSIHEPLTDTPECRSDRDTDGDGFVAPWECAGAGADNVMFWAGEGPVLSAQQGELFRRALFVR